MKILATAYACKPGNGSEDGSGWHFSHQLARFGRVWVLTPGHNREAIESATASGDIEFVYVDVPRWPADSALANRFRRTHYNIWQAQILGTAKRLHRTVGFDVVHHLTYGQYWTGSWMGRLGVPFVWGPVGGGESAPTALIDQLPADGRTFERKRDFARTVGRLSPAVRSAARRAALSLATTDDSRRAIESLTRRPWERSGPVRLLSNSALPDADLDQFTAVARSRSGFNVVCVGRLEHWKGFHLAVGAFATVAAVLPHAALHIVGEGPADAYLRSLVRELALEQRVTFHGRLPRAEVLDRLAKSHVLVHPSLHDSAGWATLEAAAAGLPVVCLDIGGPAFQVTDETGIKIPVDDPDAVVPRIATALLTLARDPKRAATLGAAGRRRVEQSFTWNRIGDELASMAPYARARAFVGEPSG